jgi:hypothetical protein
MSYDMAGTADLNFSIALTLLMYLSPTYGATGTGTRYLIQLQSVGFVSLVQHRVLVRDSR